MKNGVHKWTLAMILLITLTNVFAQNVDVTATGGTLTGSYATLKETFDSINSGYHTGAITIGISNSTTETATAALNASGTGLASYTSVLISPQEERPEPFRGPLLQEVP